MRKTLLLAMVAVLTLTAAALGDVSQGYVPSEHGDDLRFGDGNELRFGGVASFAWEAADANANYLWLELPTGGAIDVPAFGVGIGIDGDDLGWFNGRTQPLIFVRDADQDSYIGLTFSADDTPQLVWGGLATTISILGLVIGTNVQAWDTDLDALAGVTGAANAIPYFTGAHTAGVISSSANMVSLLGSADYAAARTNLSLVPGANVQAYDAELLALAGLASAANAIPYFTGAGTAGVITSSANMVSLLGSADYATARTNLSLVPGTNVQAYDAELLALAGLTSAANTLPYFTGAGTAGTITSSANMVSLLGSADYATARTNLSLAPGTDVQAYDTDLAYLAGFTPTANVKTILNAADFAAVTTALSLTIGTNTQAYDADLTYLAGFTPTADVKTILNAANAAAINTALSLTIGTNTQAYDADLTYLAGFTPTADVKTILNAANAAAVTTALALTIGTNTQAYDADLTTYAALPPTATEQIALEHGNSPVVLCQRHRATVAEINGGHEILPAIPGHTYRIVSVKAIAYGGSVGTTTTVDILGTQAAGSVKLVTFAQASLVQSAVLTAGGAGTVVLTDGSTFIPCDANSAVTVGKTGGAADTATGVDFIVEYVIE